MLPMEKSISGIASLVGSKVQIIAYGISYVGLLQSIDHERGVLELCDGKDTVTLELERIEKYSLVEGD